MISKNFIKSSAIYTLAGALPMASAIILLPFYIAYLPTEVYGVLTLSLAFSVLVQVIVTYSFDTSLYIHYHEFKNDHQKLSSFISSVFIFMLLSSVAVAGFFSLTGAFIFEFVFSNKTLSFYPHGLISIGIGIFQAIFKVNGNLLQTREKPQVFLWSNVVSFGIIAITSIVGLKLFPGTLIGPLGGRLIAGLLATAWVLARIFREFGFHPQSPWTLTSFSFNAYTFVYQLQQWTINYLDRFLLIPFMSLSAIGIYDFALKCVAPIELLLNGLNASINPKVVKNITTQTSKRSTPEINRYFYGLVSTILLIVCITIIVIPFLLEVVIKKSEYASSIQYIPLLALVFIFKSMRIYFVLPYTVLKKMQRLTMLNFFIALAKIGLMVLFVQRWQLYGVIISAFIAYAIEMFLLWYYLKNDYPMKFNFAKLIAVPLMLFIVILFTETNLDSSYLLLAHLAYGALCIIFLCLAYRNELKLLNPFKILK